VALAAVVGVAAGYGLAVDPVVYAPGQVLYPLVWLAVSVATLWRVVRPRLGTLDAVSGLVGAGYTVVLFAVAGLLRLGETAPGVAVHHGFPGWGPTLAVSGPVALTLVPFLTAGYATLGSLAAVAVGQTRAGAAPGLLGLFACVSCAAPLLGAIAGALGSGSLAAALSGAQYPVATAVFLLSVGGFVFVLRSGT
jgi:hypothetical protein